MSAVYFSAVTIATVGYGDFQPTKWYSKLVVMMEIASGILLLGKGDHSARPNAPAPKSNFFAPATSRKRPTTPNAV